MDNQEYEKAQKQAQERKKKVSAALPSQISDGNGSLHCGVCTFVFVWWFRSNHQYFQNEVF